MVEEIVVRVNGTLPAISELGKGNARAQEVESNPAMNVNTSCSFVMNQDGKPVKHILIDAGNGVQESLKRECGTGILAGRCSVDSVLLTHSHEDRIGNLPAIINEFGSPSIYSTQECWDKVVAKFPELRSVQHVSVSPGQSFQLDGIDVTPVSVEHSSDAPGSIIYVVQHQGKKVIFAWDVLSVPNKGDPIFTAPDLLIIDAHSYNSHPETGHLSVLGVYDLIKRWNPKEVYLVNYSGLADLKNQDNPYARVPKKPMTSGELASRVSDDLSPWGGGWNERVKVASHGMLWKSSQKLELLSPHIEEDMAKLFTEKNYTFVIRKGKKGLEVTAETGTMNYGYEFVKVNVESEGRKLVASSKGGLLAKPVQMLLEIDDSSDPAKASIKIGGGGNIKMLDQDVSYSRHIDLSKSDADRLRQFLMGLR